MSRKYNGRGSGKKARGVGSVGMSKHRKSGGRKSGHAPRKVRERVARLMNAMKAHKRAAREVYACVAELLKVQRKQRKNR